MGGRQVDRWDTDNKEMPKYPIPLWGATSIKVKAPEAVGPIFPVKREHDFAANELKSDPLTQAKQPWGKSLFPTHAIQSRKTNMVSMVWAPLNPPVMLGVNPKLNMVPLMVLLMAKMVLCPNHPQPLTWTKL